jgi:hypothetical protein
MQISTLQFLIFVIVLILLEVVAKDTNVLVVGWTLLWSIWMYIVNQPNNFLSCAQGNKQQPQPQSPSTSSSQQSNQPNQANQANQSNQPQPQPQLQPQLQFQLQPQQQAAAPGGAVGGGVPPTNALTPF